MQAPSALLVARLGNYVRCQLSCHSRHSTRDAGSADAGEQQGSRRDTQHRQGRPDRKLGARSHLLASDLDAGGRTGEGVDAPSHAQDPASNQPSARLRANQRAASNIGGTMKTRSMAKTTPVGCPEATTGWGTSPVTK